MRTRVMCDLCVCGQKGVHGGVCELHMHVHMRVDPACGSARVYGPWPCSTRSGSPPKPPAPGPSQSPQHVKAPPSCMRLAALSISVCLTKRKPRRLGGTPVAGLPSPCPLCCVTRMGGFSPAPSTICCFPRSLRPEALRGVPGGTPRASPAPHPALSTL